MKIEIEITGSGSELQGVGRAADGRVAFVPGALPGERVRAEIVRDAGRFLEARLEAVLEPSPERAEPVCPAFGACGGCAARHMNYAYSLELKRQKVEAALRRIGGAEVPVLPTIGADAQERCRNKAEYACELQDGVPVAGLRMNRSRRVIEVEDCLLQSELSVRILRGVRSRMAQIPGAKQFRFLVTRTNRAGQATLTIAAEAPVTTAARQIGEALQKESPELISVVFCRLNRRPAHALDGECTLLLGERVIRDELLGLTFELSPQSFFQVNPQQAEKLYLKAFEAIDLSPSMRILDVYCGAGTITLNAAARCAFATGVEIVAPAIENAKRNAKLNGLSEKSRFICGDAAKVIPRMIADGQRFDAAILDPPRKGADASVLHALADAGIEKIAYVSCDPATLARDVKLLSARGYRAEWAQPVDMFPWTEHVETVVLLSRIGLRE